MLAILPGSEHLVQFWPLRLTLPTAQALQLCLSVLSRVQSPLEALHSVPASHWNGLLQALRSKDTMLGDAQSRHTPKAENVPATHVTQPVRLALGPLPGRHFEHDVRCLSTTSPQLIHSEEEDQEEEEDHSPQLIHSTPNCEYEVP